MVKNKKANMKANRWNPLTICLIFVAALAARAASESPAPPKLRLSGEVRPVGYTAELTVVPERDTFNGAVTIDLQFARRASFLWLHGHGLTVTNAYLQQDGRQISATALAGGEEFLGFKFEHSVASGKARLRISYSGAMSDKDFSGLFRRQQGGQWYAATQMEATWARRVFPCFDEPAFKVPWRLTLHVKQEHTALANTTAVSETNEPAGMKCVRFAVTRPLPSYLLAVVVGPFERLDLGTAGRKNTPVRIFAPRGRAAEAAFASGAIPDLLRRLEDYYGIPYPYEKLDQVAVPQFPGAMENAGLIIYDETILLSPPARETIEFKRGCADVCTHEMAHQWFGDLVTMAWWDDIWLNEAFATWITPKIVDAWKPEWRANLDQSLATIGAANADSLVNARRIRQPIQTQVDIDNAFDGITYSKGAAVLGMFESWIGKETFRKGIQAYLKRHAWENATTTDFLKSLNQAARQDIASAFSTFLDQPGIPLVSAEVQDAAGASPGLLLSQRRYLPVGSSGDPQGSWRVPLRLRYQSGGREKQIGRLMVDRQENMLLKTEPPGLEWLLLNRDGAGYYVVAYRGDLLRKLLQLDAQCLSPAERISIVHSLTASVRSGDILLGEALPLHAKLLRDSERRVVTLAAGALERAREIVPEELMPNYRHFVRATLDPLLKDASWQTPPGETEDARLQRLSLLALSARKGEDSRLIEEAKRFALAWLADRQALAPDAADAVLEVAAQYADGALFDKLLSEAKSAQDPSDRQRLIRALGACNDLALAQRALEALAAREFPAVDSIALLQALSSRIETRSQTYDYLKRHYDAVVAALPGELFFWYLPMLAWRFDEPEWREDVNAFFKGKPVELTGGPRILAQVSESIALNHAFKQAQQRSLAEFLKTQ